MENIFTSIRKKPSNGRRTCSVPTKCTRPEGQSFDEMMERPWEELVIKFDKKNERLRFQDGLLSGRRGLLAIF
jgi:hypothetical protein